MAEASRETKVVETTRVNLKLTLREARLLDGILARVGGSRSGVRGEVDKIFEANRSAAYSEGEALGEEYNNLPKGLIIVGEE